MPKKHRIGYPVSVPWKRMLMGTLELLPRLWCLPSWRRMIRLLLVLQGLLRAMETLTDVEYGVRLVWSGVCGLTRVLRHMLAAEPGAGVLTASCCLVPLAQYGLTRDAANSQRDETRNSVGSGLLLGVIRCYQNVDSLSNGKTSDQEIALTEWR
jgi:hypothetical protein